MNEQSELTPKQPAERKTLRLYLWISVLCMLIAALSLLGGAVMLPGSIAPDVLVLWGISLAAVHLANSVWHRQADLQIEDVMSDLDRALDLLEHDTQIFDRQNEAYNTLKAILENDKNRLDRITPLKRGRPKLPIEEMRHEIDRAEQKRAELQAQGHTPTEAEIAKAIGLSSKTLQRYRDQVDNKGQK